MKKTLFLCLGAALVFGWTSIGAAQQGKVPVEVWQWLQTADVVRVIVRLHTAVATTPEGALHDPAQQRAIVEAENKLGASLAGTKYRWTRVSTIIPVINLEVGNDALAVLDRSPLVKSVTPIPLLPRGQVPVEIWQQTWANGVVWIIVELHTDVATTPQGALHQPAQRRAIATVQDKLLTSLDGTEYKVTKRLTIMPFIGLQVEPGALVVVDRSHLVKRVVEERPVVEGHLGVRKIPEEVWLKARTNGVVRVIVQLEWMPERYLEPQAVLAQRQAIAEAQDELLASLAGTKYKVTGRLRFPPGIWLEVGVDALAVLERSPLVTRVQAEGPPAKPARP